MRLIVSVRFRWWTKAYLYGLGLLCRLTGREPDIDRIAERLVQGAMMKLTEVK